MTFASYEQHLFHENAALKKTPLITDPTVFASWESLYQNFAGSYFRSRAPNKTLDIKYVLFFK